MLESHRIILHLKLTGLNTTHQLSNVMMLAVQDAQSLYHKRPRIKQSLVRIEVSIFVASLLPHM